MKRVEDLAKWLSDIHNKHRDGCKSSCLERYIGYHHMDHSSESPYWYVSFGGYCFGDLPRRSEVKARTFEELETLLKRTVLEAIERENAGVEDYPAHEGG